MGLTISAFFLSSSVLLFHYDSSQISGPHSWWLAVSVLMRPLNSVHGQSQTTLTVTNCLGYTKHDWVSILGPHAIVASH